MGLALTSAALLVLSFPNFNQPWAAWVALVPWLVRLRRLNLRQAFWWSWAIGFAFFLGSIWWLIHVTALGWLLLCAYLALYFGLFGWFATTVFTVHRTPYTVHLLLPSAWVSLEFLRSHLLTGFGWNLLAYSQTSWLPAIQLAEVAGAWGISFVIVLVNCAVALGCSADVPARDRWRSALLAAGCLLATLGYGAWRIPRVVQGQTARVAVVQGNIPQEEKWDEASREGILQQYERLTDAAAATQPHLIVWPETAVPGSLGADEGLTQRVAALAKSTQRPLLVGAPTLRVTTDGVVFFNSAMLVEPSGELAARYDKLHLVPFGEFIPCERLVPWLRRVLPPIGDFIAGQAYTVFQLGSRFEALGSRQERVGLQPRASRLELKFSVLICFEDLFPGLARRFAREGARLLLVITNDAWFGPTAAAYQHAQASALRAVELRVPVVRAANTGWSGCIDPAGRWIGSVHDAHGVELFVPGTHTCDVPLGIATSLYQSFGDWFAVLCLLVAGAWLGVSAWRCISARKPV